MAVLTNESTVSVRVVGISWNVEYTDDVVRTMCTIFVVIKRGEDRGVHGQDSFTLHL